MILQIVQCYTCNNLTKNYYFHNFFNCTLTKNLQFFIHAPLPPPHLLTNLQFKKLKYKIFMIKKLEIRSIRMLNKFPKSKCRTFSEFLKTSVILIFNPPPLQTLSEKSVHKMNGIKKKY